MSTAPAVIDTNVLVAGVLTANPDAPTARLVDGMLQGDFAYLLSVELVDEYRRLLLRPKVQERHGLQPEEVDVLLTELIRWGAIRSSARRADAAPDAGDQHLWDLLAAQPGAVLVTGDRRLREQPPEGVSVVGAEEFLRLAEGRES